MEALVSMQAAADAKGVHYDTFRKHWRAFVRDGFPAPVADARPYRWRPSSLAAWQTRAEAATRVAITGPATGPDAHANQNHPEAGPAPGRRIQRQRDAVLALMTGG